MRLYYLNLFPSSGSVLIKPGAVFATNFAISNTLLARVNTTSAGAIALSGNNSNSLDFSNFPALSLAAFGGSYIYSGSLTSNATAGYLLGGATGTLTISSALADHSGVTPLTVIGPGTLVLTGTNTYSGQTQLLGGTLAVSSSANLGDGSSTNSILFDGGTLQAAGSFSSGRALTVNAGGGTIDTNGHGVTLSGSLTGTGSLTKQGSGTLTVSSFQLTGSSSAVTLSAGNLATTPAGGTSKAATLSFSSTSTLDLADNKLILTATAGTTVRDYLHSGYGSGVWDGATGLTSSTAAADPNHVTGIAWAAAGSLGVSTWGGLAVNSTDVVTKYTWAGDGNMDGVINGDDYALIDLGYASSNPARKTWIFGDFNYDGAVDASDYAIIDASYAYEQDPGHAHTYALLASGSTDAFSPGLIPVDGLTPDFIARRVAEFGEEYQVKLDQLLAEEEQGSGAFAPSFVSLVPEPAALSLLLPAISLCFRRRRSRC